MKDKIFQKVHPVKYREAVISAKPKLFDRVKEELLEVQKEVLLKNYSTYRIGGPAKYFFVVKSKNDLISALKTAKKFKLPVFILGGGSNLLISDKGFNGLAIKISILDVKFEDNKAFVGAGTNLIKLAYLSADKGLSGFEWAAGIPGTVGGAVHGNAHAFGTKISDLVKEVQTLNLKNLKFKNFTKKQCCFSLKNSIFKKNKNLVIVSAVLEFKKQDTEQIKNRIKEFLKHRVAKHPMNFPSAGSTFVNPVVKIYPVKYRKAVISALPKLFDRMKNKKFINKYPELEGYIKKGVIPSGYLIEKCGLAGRRIGNAQISEKHCNFIINLGGAKSKDVLSLMDLAKKNVKENFGVSLEPEIQLVGFSKK